MIIFSRWRRFIGITLSICLLAGIWYYFYLYSPRKASAPPRSTPLTLTPSLQPKKKTVTPTPLSQPATTILFTGDAMLDRDIRSAAQKQGNDFILAPVREILLAQDLVVANLEGPITNNPSRSLGSAVGSPANYSFTFDPSWAETLYRHNIKVVNLGNNHILNFGQDGLNQTLTALARANVAAFGYTGVASTSSPLANSYVIQDHQQKIALINYNQFAVGSEAAALTAITRWRSQVDWVVIYTHWGNEYQPVAAASTTQLAHQFIDAGADLIIGSHPHVIQNHEVYRGKQIYYSLGNFVFDQYFEPAVKKGLLIRVTFKLNPAEISVTEIPVFLLPNGQTSLTSL